MNEKVFQSLSSLNPCRLYIDTPVYTINQKSAKLPQAVAAVRLQEICLRKSKVWWCLATTRHPVFGSRGCGQVYSDSVCHPTRLTLKQNHLVQDLSSTTHFHLNN